MADSSGSLLHRTADAIIAEDSFAPAGMAEMRALRAGAERTRRNTLLQAALGSDGPAPTSVKDLIADEKAHLAWSEASPELQDSIERHVALNRSGRARHAERQARHAADAFRAAAHLHPAAFQAVDFSHPAHAALHASDLYALVRAQEAGPGDALPLSALIADFAAHR